MKRRRRIRLRLLGAWLTGVIAFVLPSVSAGAREVETDGMKDSGGVLPIAPVASDSLGWWWVAIVAGIIVGVALITAVVEAVRHQAPRAPRPHPA